MKSRLRLFCFGAHRQRMPVSYPALALPLANEIEFVASPDEADLNLFSHNVDLEQVPRAVVDSWRRKQTPFVLLSEEPFWDTIWGRNPLRRHRVLPTPYGDLPVIQLNHSTSDIYTFERIPYYLLTNHRFASMYAYRFRRNITNTRRAWEEHFSACSADVCFMFERRPEPYHAAAWIEDDLFGLCDWRTRVAEECVDGHVERLGKSWGGRQSRFDLPNWYLDKMVQLDGRSKLMGAIENTHHPHYITEKIFDAFANGAVPLYWANGRHRIFEFDLPPEAWINLHGLSAEEAALQVRNFKVTAQVLEAYQYAQDRLENLFNTPEIWVNERESCCKRLMVELTSVLS